MWTSVVAMDIWMQSITSCEPIIICLKYKGEVLHSVAMLKMCSSGYLDLFDFVIHCKDSTFHIWFIQSRKFFLIL